jgi:signal recognition particle receptor subunit beta
MSLLDPRQKTISLKVVYYGPGLGGKTTSLKHIHQVIDPEGKIKLVSLDTDEDRTLFFDFLPIELGLVGRFQIKIQGFTVPGQVKYNMTRRYVLTGADGIVFVADSDPSRLVENVESLINLGDNLRAHGLNVNNIPLVFQYNKQDLSNAVAPVELEEKLNFRKVPSYATIATKGDGVFEAFTAVSKLMVSRVIKTYNLKEEQADEGRILAEVESRLRAQGSRTVARSGPTEAAEPPAQSRAPSPVAAATQAIAAMTGASSASADKGAADDRTAREAAEFIESIQGNAGGLSTKPPEPPAGQPEKSPASAGPRRTELPMAPRVPKTVRPSPSPKRPESPERAPTSPRDEEAGSPTKPPRPAGASDPERPERGAGKSTGSRGGTSIPNLLRTLQEIGRKMASGSSFENVATMVLSQACQVMEAMGGSLLVSDETGEKLEPLALTGFRVDPILKSGSDDGRQLMDLLDGCGDLLFLSREHHPEVHEAVQKRNPGIEGALVLPLVVADRVRGGLVIYLDEPINLAQRKETIKILVVLAYQLSVGLVLNRPEAGRAIPDPKP